MDVETLVKYLGGAGLLVWFLWSLYQTSEKRKREIEDRLQVAVAQAEANCRKDRDELADRLRQLEDYCRGELQQVCRDCTSAIREATEINRGSAAVMARAIDLIDPSGRHPELHNGRGDVT